MKLLFIEENISPNGFFKKTNTINKTVFLFFLMFYQNYNSFSTSNHAFYLSDKSKIGSESNVKVFNGKSKRLSFPLFASSRSTTIDNIVISSVLKTSYCTGEESSIVINTRGTYNAGNTFSIQLSDKNGSFANPTIIDRLQSSVSGTHNLNFRIPINTSIGLGYRIRAISSSPINVSADNGFNIQITTIPTAVVSDTSKSICSGSSVSLTATCSQGTLKWYNANQNGSLIIGTSVSPVNTTEYFASCEAGTGCASARVKQVIVVNKVNAIVPAFASSCLNSDLNLAVITDHLDLRYTWAGPNGFVSTLQNPTVSNLTTIKEGIYSVSITNPSNCSMTATTSVSIGQLLQNLNVVGDVTVCYNGTINLSALTSVTTGMNYSWTGPNGFTATGQNISRASFTTINNSTIYHGGLYRVVASNSSGCSGATFVDIVVGNPPNVPPLTPNEGTCEGSPFTLNWAIGGANFRSYTWTGPSGFTSSSTAVCNSNLVCNNATATVPNFQATNVGTYTIRANFLDENNNSCFINVAQNVTLKPNPNITVTSNSAVCVGNLLTLQAIHSNITSGISSYSWTGPNNFMATVQNPNLITSSVSQTGIYKLIAVGLNSCVATAITSVNVIQSFPPIVEPTASVVLGNSITLASTGCNGGTVEWFKTIDNQPVTMPVSPTVTTLYYAICNIQGCVSGRNGDVTVSIKPPIVISAKTGNWEDFNTWDILRVPLPIDSVVIRPNHIVTINSFVTAKWLAWSGFGNLHFANSNSKLNLLGNPITPPPVLESNPSTVIEGISVTLTARGNGVVSWYKNGINLNINGTNYTVDQPVKGDIYTAKLAISGIISVASNSIVVTPSPVLSPPLLVSNPANVVEGIAVTFTALGSGVISWYKNGVNLNISGSSYTVNQPVAGDVYTTKRTELGVISGESNVIIVSSTTPPPVVNPPVLSASSSNVIENISVTFTATGSGIISWYKNGINLNITGSTYTVNLPVAGDIYTTKRTDAGITSSVSNSITIGASSPPLVVNAPVLESNPVNIAENIPVTFTARGTGEISWFKNGINLNINGANYTVNQPIGGDVYTTKSTINGITSETSNALTVISANSNVTITVPNKPPYYFSDGHPPSHYDGNRNLPAIFTNQPRYDPVNDMVWLTNNKIKIGINLKRGGQLAWASLANATSNLVYNGYDGGFQVTLDAYQRKDGYTQGGEVSGSAIRGMPTSYNVTHGGDYLNNAVSLIDYHAVPNGYYVKLRPIHYPLNAKFSETYIEVTYTIIRNSVKIDYRYTSFRTDGQWNGGGFDGAGAPACFMVNTLNKYKSYDGNSPWSFLPLPGRNLPIQNMGQNPAGVNSTEYWGMVYNDQNPNSAVGVYNATNGGNSTYFTFKQLEVYPGNGPGTEFTNGFTFFQPFIDFNIADRGNYVKDITAYMMIGSELEIRSEVYRISGHENNIPRF